MKEIPILYSTPMIQAKLAGRKTQTRRIVKGVPSWAETFGYTVFTPERHISVRGHSPEGYGEKFIRCPYGKPGDLHYAKETHYYEKYFNGLSENVWIRYRADYGDEPVAWNWRPSIFLHKEYARIWDRVVSIRVERLQDISEEDAIAEGIYPCTDPLGGYTYKDSFGWITAKEAYRALWESINGEGSWDLNPYVWVVTTENVSLTGKPKTLFEGLMDADLGR